MNEERLLTLLQMPHVSEKTASKVGQYVFKVKKEAKKPEIKRVVEKVFDVQVKSVRVCNMKTKPTRFGQIPGKRKAWKKAYVTLKEGNEIELTGQS